MAVKPLGVVVTVKLHFEVSLDFVMVGMIAAIALIAQCDVLVGFAFEVNWPLAMGKSMSEYALVESRFGSIALGGPVAWADARNRPAKKAARRWLHRLELLGREAVR